MTKRAKRERRKSEQKAAADALAATKTAEDARRLEQFRAEVRAQRCPSCGGNASRLYYGMPRYDAELDADLTAGLIVLAGCDFSETDPKWLCQTCNHTWGRLFPERPAS